MLCNLTASAEIRGGHTDPDANELYLIIDDDIKQFQGDTSSFGTGVFKSKSLYYLNQQVWALLKLKQRLILLR